MGPGAGLEASAPPPPRLGRALGAPVTRAGPHEFTPPVHASFFAFNIRPLSHLVSLCLFPSLLGFVFYPLYPAQSPPAPSPPKLDSCCTLPLLSLPLLANSSQFYLPPSFLILGLQVLCTVWNLSLPCVTSSLAGPYHWLCASAHRSGTSELSCCSGQSSSFSDSWNNTCNLLFSIPSQTCGFHRVTQVTHMSGRKGNIHPD